MHVYLHIDLCFTGIRRQIVVETQEVYLPCPGPVEGSVKWSRERNGERVDLITARNDNHVIHNNPLGRYDLTPEKTLIIKSAVASDSGTYYCDDADVRLTVIPSGNSRLY